MKHIPRKRFGQNFLTDQLVISSIINAIAPQEDDHMVEIGPGQGAMTALLLQGLKELHVVEIDRDLVVLLEKKFKSANLIMHAADALQFDFGSLINAAQPDRKLRVVGNLPYNISTPLLFHLADFSAQIIDQHFMLQWRYTMDCLFIVPPSAFDPPPKVESAIVRMLPIAKPPECEQQKLELVVMKAFSQRRKVLRNCLSGLFTENQLIDLGIDPKVRPETVSVEQFVRLARELAEHA